MTQNAINIQGKLVQFLSTSTNSALNCTGQMPTGSIPQNTNGTEVLTLTITPTSASSKLIITFTAQVIADGAVATDGGIALFQDSTANALDALLASRMRIHKLEYAMVSGTTSPTTFKIRIGTTSASGSMLVNALAPGGTRILGGVSSAWLTIQEYI